MTIIAGVISRSAVTPVPASVCEALKRGISHHPADQAVEFKLGSAYLVKVDIGAFGQPAAHVSASGAVSVLAGEPLLAGPGMVEGERDAQLRVLHADWERDSFDSARWSSGTFCAAFYDPHRGVGHLVADRLGLRTLYYAIVGDLVYFASALRILEALPEVPKEVDVKAVAEITGFGYPFGSGTPYAGIKMLLPCEVVSMRKEQISSSTYFKWDAIAPIQASQDEMLRETYRLFQRAVRRRLRGDQTTFAYLSGGLDSRCTVAALRSEGAQVYTFNFSLAHTQDQVFAQQYAQKCGAIHHELPTEPGPNWSAVMAEAWEASPHRRNRMPEHSRIAWTGEGGSVGLGHVYISPEIVALLRSGNRAEAIEKFLAQQSKCILTGILEPSVASSLEGHLNKRLAQELDRIQHPDPVRGFYIFLNLNGPRRHLVNHFETIDQHRLEFQVPFYDTELLEYLTAIPVDPCLYHQLYVKWLSLFDPTVVEVAWQAYPGHVPSPVPVPAGLPDQWNAPASASHRKGLDRELRERSAAMLSDPDFPIQVLRRTRLQLMSLAWKLKLGNYDYALKSALTYYRYWKASGGQYELPSTSSCTPAGK